MERLFGDSLIAVAAGTTVMVIASSCYHWSKKGARQKQKSLSSNNCGDKEICFPLLPIESSHAMLKNVPSISTVDWYEGEVASIQDGLKERVTQILQANPWLAGHFEKREGVVSLVYKASGDILDRLDYIFTVVSASDSGLQRVAPYEELANGLVKPFLVQRGIHLLRDPSEPFLKITLIPDRDHPKDRFALIFSLSHSVGDGHTFYTLHNMLDANRPIIKLNAGRKPQVAKDITEALGGTRFVQPISNPSIGFALRFVFAVIRSSLWGPKTEYCLFWINQDWIQKQTATHNSKHGSYVSTNDIVTATFFACTQVDEGMMAINFRGKVDDCLDTDAGNYFNQWVYCCCRPVASSSAHHIRQVMNSLQGVESKELLQHPTTKPLTSWEHFTSTSLYGTMSNWSTFFQPVLLSGCEHNVHIPVLPTDPLSIPVTFMARLFLFRPGTSKRLAAVFSGHPRALEQVRACGMMGEENVYHP